MKLFYLTILPFLLSFLVDQDESVKNNCKNGYYILGKSKLKHDPQQEWTHADLKIHIQEPRIQSPERYSKITLNNKGNSFEIERDSEDGKIKRKIDEHGNFQAWLNEGIAPLEIVEKYGLNKERSEGYWNFYKTMYGLPMSITEDFYLKIDSAAITNFDDKEVYRINVELKDELFSKHWALLISTKNYELVGLEIEFPDKPEKNELIQFEGVFTSGGLNIPRIRHWYSKEQMEYLGSDIIVKEVKE